MHGEHDVERLFAQHHAALYRYLVRLTGDCDAAADAAQEAFVKLLERAPAGKLRRAWLYKVATNAALQDARTRGRRRNLLARVLPGEGDATRPPAAAAPLDVLEADERRRAVRAALDALSTRDRTVLLMREEGFTHQEIAAAVGTTTGSVGTMIARALDKLARQLPADRESL